MKTKTKIYILAASGEEEWCKDFGVKYKPLLPWGGKTIVEHLVSNIKRDLDIPVIVMGRTEWPIDSIEGAELIKVDSKNLLETISHIKPDSDYSLLVTGDSPLVRGKDLVPFLENPSDLTAGVIYKEAFSQLFPDWRKTFIPLKDGSVKLAGAALIGKNKWEIIVKEGSKYYEYRKNPLAVVQKMKLSLLIKLLIRQLTIDDVVRWVKEQFDVNAKVITASPTLGADVDNKNDYLTLKLFETLRGE